MSSHQAGWRLASHIFSADFANRFWLNRWLCKKKLFNRWLYKTLFCLNEWLWKIFQCPCSRYCILHYNFDIKHVYFTWSRYIAYCIIILKSNMSNLFQRSKYLIFTLFQRSKYFPFTWSRSAFSPWGTATTRTVLGLEKMQFIGKHIFQISCKLNNFLNIGPCNI